MIPSFNRQRWILVFGDVVLILLATQLSTRLRMGRSFNVFEIHTGTSAFTLFLYVIISIFLICITQDVPFVLRIRPCA